MDATQTEVITQARAIRVAYLVPMARWNHQLMDHIVGESVGRWGGRFTLVVPCIDGWPIPAFHSWLQDFDADFIYSFDSLSDEQRDALNEWLGPSEIGAQASFTSQFSAPQLPLKALSVTSILPSLVFPEFAFGDPRIPVLELSSAAMDDPFLRYNFMGSYELSRAMRGAMSQYAYPVQAVGVNETVAAEYLSSRGTTLRGAIEVMNAMANQSGIRSASGLAGEQCLDGFGRSERLDDGINVVIGDTVEDRLIHWNNGLYRGRFRSRRDIDLIVPTAHMNDGAFLVALASYLRSCANASYSFHEQGLPITLRSHQHGDSTLLLWERRLAPMLPDSQVSHEHMPAIAGLGANENPAFQKAIKPLSGQKSFLSGRILQIEKPEPYFFRRIPRGTVDMPSPAWAVDIDIDGVTAHGPNASAHERWRLPRRLAMATAFCDPALLDPLGGTIRPRAERSGLLTVFATATQPLPVLTIPSTADAVRWGLERGRDWGVSFWLKDRPRPAQLCHRATRSDAGQHFFGVFQLFGHIETASSFLLHRFWHEQFGWVGSSNDGKSRRAIDRFDRAQVLLKKRIGHRIYDPRDADQLNILTNVVLSLSDEDNTSIGSIDWTQLQQRYDRLLEASLTEIQTPGGLPPTLDEHRQRFQNHVEMLCQLGVLQQGFELRCPTCLFRNWISVDNMASTTDCHACRHVIRTPFHRPWQFRLHGFLHDSIHRHGIGPLFWVLERYRRIGSGSLWFEGPLNIYFTEDDFEKRRPATDIDLTIVEAGRVIMCEAKQSARAFTDPEGTAEHFKRLRPDVALIAIMARRSPEIDGKFNRFAKVLHESGIQPQLMTLEDDDISASPMP